MSVHDPKLNLPLVVGDDMDIHFCMLVNIRTVPEPWPLSRAEQMRTHTWPSGSSQTDSGEQSLLLPQRLSLSECTSCLCMLFLSLDICSLFSGISECMLCESFRQSSFYANPDRHHPLPTSGLEIPLKCFKGQNNQTISAPRGTYCHPDVCGHFQHNTWLRTAVFSFWNNTRCRHFNIFVLFPAACFCLLA